MSISPESFDDLKKLIEALSSKIDLLVNCLSTRSPTSSSTSSTELKAAFASVLADKESMAGKSTRAVLVNVPEVGDEVATVANDKIILQKIFKEMNNEYLNSVLPTIRFHRHPEVRREGAHNPRILKIQFDSDSTRNLFLKEAIRVKCGQLTGSSRAYVRPDYTTDQLRLERQLKTKAYESNLACGQIKYVVRNLELVHVKEPRELPEGMRVIYEERKNLNTNSGNLFDRESILSALLPLSNLSNPLSFPNQYQRQNRGRSIIRGNGSRAGRGRGGRGQSSTQSQSAHRTRARPSTGGLLGEPPFKAAAQSQSVVPPTTITTLPASSSNAIVFTNPPASPTDSTSPSSSASPRTHSILGN